MYAIEDGYLVTIKSGRIENSGCAKVISAIEFQSEIPFPKLISGILRF
jgi:hypothetical protein